MGCQSTTVADSENETKGAGTGFHQWSASRINDIGDHRHDRTPHLPMRTHQRPLGVNPVPAPLVNASSAVIEIVLGPLRTDSYTWTVENVSTRGRHRKEFPNFIARNEKPRVIKSPGVPTSLRLSARPGAIPAIKIADVATRLHQDS